VVGEEETGIQELFRRHDERWEALDFVGVAALWDTDDAAASYIGEEYQKPVTGWVELHRHWARLGARLSEARMESTVVHVNVLAPDLALGILRCRWQLVGVESPTRHEGNSWVTAVLRRRADGWRLVHYAEAPMHAFD
jgi:uncharacterized protein (TIGR02246 family)